MNELQSSGTPLLSENTIQSEPRIGIFAAHDAEYLSIPNGEGSGGVVGLRYRTFARERPQQAQVDLVQTEPERILVEMAAGIAYELSSPLGALLLSTETGLRWLDQSEPDVAKMRNLLRRMLDDARRASDIVARIRLIAAGQVTQKGIE